MNNINTTNPKAALTIHILGEAFFTKSILLALVLPLIFSTCLGERSRMYFLNAHDPVSKIIMKTISVDKTIIICPHLSGVE